MDYGYVFNVCIALTGELQKCKYSEDSQIRIKSGAWNQDKNRKKKLFGFWGCKCWLYVKILRAGSEAGDEVHMPVVQIVFAALSYIKKIYLFSPSLWRSENNETFVH